VSSYLGSATSRDGFLRGEKEEGRERGNEAIRNSFPLDLCPPTNKGGKSREKKGRKGRAPSSRSMATRPRGGGEKKKKSPGRRRGGEGDLAGSNAPSLTARRR